MLKKSQRLLLVSSALCAIALVVILVLENPMAKMDVRLCLPRSPTSALPLLAASEGFFEREGLKVHLSIEEFGKNCLESLLANQTDFSVSPVSPVVSALNMGSEIAIISETHRATQNPLILSLHETGLKKPEDLEGKTVGIIRGTNSESLLRLFMMTHGTPMNSLKLRRVSSPSEIEELFRKREIHAAVVWEPHLSALITQSSPDYFQSFSSSFFTDFSVVTATPGLLKSRPTLAQKFLSALYEAQLYYEAHEEQARQKVVEDLHPLSQELAQEIWPKVKIREGLSSVLLSMMKHAQYTHYSQDIILAETSGINIFRFLFPEALRNVDKRLVTYE